ncbi:MAG: hypothetical protein K8R36_13935 [Planctomycetales bacterium]|nr:hypothetical protein [Planctomycetales bacterium]
MDRICNRRRAVTSVLILGGLLVVAIFAAPAQAQLPRVAFDMPYAVSCRDVTPPEFATANPGDKLIEVKLGISSLLQAGKEKDLAQYFIRMETPQRTMQVHDFLPKTAHESLQGNTTITKNSETTLSLGINITGHYQALTGTAITPGISQKNGSCVKYDLLPPLETVTASGTILRGSGAYFKLKSSERNLLEGERDFALIVRVPRGWRGDYLHVRCEAEGISRGLVSSLDQKQVCGQRDFLISLYLEGDLEARRAAEELSRAEVKLRNIAHVKAKEIHQRVSPSFSSQIGLSSSPSTSIPSDWQAKLLFSHPSRVSIPKKLPREVVQAAQDFQNAQQGLAQFSGWKVLTAAN